MNELVKKHGFIFVLFFSNWAILLHILYYLNILPCTYSIALFVFCLLYTSDAADDRISVDLGGRRIIKKKRHGISSQDKHYGNF